MEIKNLEKAAKRILKAIKKKERIIIYGDSDMDGAASVVIIQDSIKSLDGNISATCFPDRETEGYGITRKSLERFKDLSPALIITLDFGISNFKEIKLAKKLGFEVIVVDHHESLGKLPEADIIVDPKQEEDEYPFKELACAGVAFKLSQALLKDKMTPSLEKNFLELTALATIADMMPRESENKIFIEEGLSFLPDSWRPAIRTFLEMEPFKNYDSINDQVFKMISILNTRALKKTAENEEEILPASFRFLTCPSKEKAEKIIEELLDEWEKKMSRIQEIEEEIESRLKKEGLEPIIFQGDVTFESIIISSVASSLCNKYDRPVFLYKKMAKESSGTVRSTSEINSVSLMKNCAQYLITYGGHARASGFRLKNENLDKFKNCLIKNL
jgi:single-stranded-DNA-specific exonuclease